MPTANVPPPDELVVTSAHPVGYSTGAGPQVAYDVYLNFTRTAGDPGNWNYDLCRTFGNGATNCANNFTPTNIPNRLGWASIHDTGSIDINTLGSMWQFNVSANLTISGVFASGQATKNVPVGLQGVGEQNQTGNVTLLAPIIRSVSVTGNITSPTGATVALIWENSLSDPNATTTGDFNYIVLQQNLQPSQAINCNLKELALGTCTAGPDSFIACNPFQVFSLDPSTTCQTCNPIGVIVLLRNCQIQSPGGLTYIEIPSMSGAGTGGLRYQNITAYGSAPFYMSLDVTPVDNATGLIGTTSCQTTVDPSQVNEFQRCGIFLSDNPNINPEVPVQGTPVFPGLDVSALATTTGMDLASAGYALAAFLVLGLVILGFRAGGPVAAGVVGTLGVGLGYAFNLLPAWLIIVLVVLSAAIVVFRFKGGSS